VRQTAARIFVLVERDAARARHGERLAHRRRHDLARRGVARHAPVARAAERRHRVEGAVDRELVPQTFSTSSTTGHATSRDSNIAAILARVRRRAAPLAPRA
jgi:hypothetical protein